MWKFIDIDVDTVYYQTYIFFLIYLLLSHQYGTDILYDFGISITYQNVFVQNVLIAEDDGSNYRILLKVPTEIYL